MAITTEELLARNAGNAITTEELLARYAQKPITTEELLARNQAEQPPAYESPVPSAVRVAAHVAGGLGGAVAFGLGAMAKLATGGSAEDVLELKESIDKYSEKILPTLSESDRKALAAINYPFELLAKGADAAQAYTTEKLIAAGMDEKTARKIGATVGTAIEFGGPIAIPAGVRGGAAVSRAVRRPIVEMEGLRPSVPTMPEVSPQIRRKAPGRVVEKEPVPVEPEPVSARSETVARPTPEAPEVQPSKAAPIEPQPAKSADVAVPDLVTSIKNKVVESERLARGEMPVEKIVLRDVPELETGRLKVESGEINPRALARAIADGKVESVSATENGALLYDKLRLKQEASDLTGQILEARKAKDFNLEASLRTRLMSVENHLANNEVATIRAGTLQSSALRTRQYFIRDDFSLERMDANYRIINGVDEVPKHVHSQFKKWSERIEELNKQIAEREAALERLVEREAEQRLKIQAAAKKTRAERHKAKLDLDAEFHDLALQLKALMTEQRGSVSLVESEGPKSVKIIRKMAENRVQRGKVSAAQLVDDIATKLREIGLDVSERDIRDAITGYGREYVPPNKTEAQRYLADLKRQMTLISKIEDVRSGKLPPGKKRVEAKSAEVVALENELRQAMVDEGFVSPKDPMKGKLDAYKRRVAKRIEDLQARINTNNFVKPERQKIVADEELAKLLQERERLMHEYKKAEADWKYDNMTPAQKAAFQAWNSLNEFRTIRTSYDLSAVFRQGAILTLSHPVMAAKGAFPAMIKAIRSDLDAFSVMQEIKSRPNYPLYERAKLYLAEPGAGMLKAEEAFMAKGYAEKYLPGVAASQRAYTTYLNRLRADAFDNMVRNLAKSKVPTQAELESIGKAINVFTGRGGGLKTEQAAKTLNTVFFAPRYVMSRFETALGTPYFKAAGDARSLIAKEYARFLAGLGTVYMLSSLAGGEVGADPRGSDFGKVKIGEKTYIDPMAGLSQSIVFLTRLLTGERKTLRGNVVGLREEYTLTGARPKYGVEDVWGTVGRFARSKLAPGPGMAVDIIGQKTYTGQPIDDVYFLEQAMPLAFNDIKDVLQTEHGYSEQAAAALLAIFGMGVQTIEEKRSRH